MSGDFKIEWKLDSLTTILFRPNFSFGNNDSWNTGNNASFQKNDPYEYTFGDAHTIIDNPLDMTQFDALPDSIKTNLSRSGGDSDGNSKSVRGNLLLNHRMMKPGRNMSVRLDANWSDDDNTNFNLNDVRYFQEDPRTHTKSPDQFLYRYRTSPNDSKGITAGFTYSEPLLEGLTLQLNYQFSHSRRTSDSRTYNMSYNDIEQNSADPYRNNRMFNQLRWQVQGLDSLRQFLLDNVGMLPLNFDEMRDSLECTTQQLQRRHQQQPQHGTQSSLQHGIHQCHTGCAVSATAPENRLCKDGSRHNRIKKLCTSDSDRKLQI